MQNELIRKPQARCFKIGTILKANLAEETFDELV